MPAQSGSRLQGRIVGILVATFIVMPSIGHAQPDPRVAKSVEALKTMTAKLGAPKLEGREAVGGKDAPALYFGTTKINNNFDIVDAVGEMYIGTISAPAASRARIVGLSRHQPLSCQLPSDSPRTPS
jgi:hypothetical protein